LQIFGALHLQVEGSHKWERRKNKRKEKRYSKRPLKLHVYKLKLHISYILKSVYYTYLVILTSNRRFTQVRKERKLERITKPTQNLIKPLCLHNTQAPQS
jgi:hypothetical protein